MKNNEIRRVRERESASYRIRIDACFEQSKRKRDLLSSLLSFPLFSSTRKIG
jgi:hypothetical protein